MKHTTENLVHLNSHNLTLGKDISEATNKLNKYFDVIPLNLSEATYEQKTCIEEYMYEMFIRNEEEETALDNLYLNTSNGHIYILEMSDDGYSYEDLMPTYVFFKDEKGNVWDCICYGDDTCEYEVAVIDVDENGHYTNTNITWYMSDDEFANLERIEVEVDKVW